MTIYTDKIMFGLLDVIFANLFESYGSSRVKATIFFIENISFSLKIFSGHFYGQSFIKTVRGPLVPKHYDHVRNFNYLVTI